VASDHDERSRKNLILGVQQVSACLYRIANDRHWNENDYSIFFRLNLDAERFHVIFVGPDFDHGEYFENYKVVWRALYECLEGNASRGDLLSSLNLVLMGTHHVRSRGDFAIPPDYLEFQDGFETDFRRAYYPSV
jgi:hypothetical protein